MMLYLHHMVHAVTIAFIFLLLKMYFELRTLYEHEGHKLKELSIMSPLIMDAFKSFHNVLNECSSQCHTCYEHAVFTPVSAESTFNISTKHLLNLSDRFGSLFTDAKKDLDVKDHHNITSLIHDEEAHHFVLFDDVSVNDDSNKISTDAEYQLLNMLHFVNTAEIPTSDATNLVFASPVSAGSSDFSTADSQDSIFSNEYYLGSDVWPQGFSVEIGMVTSIDEFYDGFDIYPNEADDFEQQDDVFYSNEYRETERHDRKELPTFDDIKLDWLLESELDVLIANGSSIKCNILDLGDHMCQFKNLCFDPYEMQFVFLHGSVNSEEISVQVKHKIVESLLHASTVMGYKAKHYSVLFTASLDIYSQHVAVISDVALMFQRFKPDNVMHVLHDDLIPLFHTLISLKLIPSFGSDKHKFPITLFLADEYSESEHYNIYNVFHENGLFTMESLVTSFHKMPKTKSMVCFSDMYVGLLNSTVWYQYGFTEPQDPVPNSNVKSSNIHGASVFLLNIAERCPLCEFGEYLVLISRKKSRLILNEGELVLSIAQYFKVKVMTIDLDTYDLPDIISVVRSSAGLIGVHGSLLAVAMFLPQGSILVELFPYAVNPDHYTPYKTLCHVPGMMIAYRSWANGKRIDSLPHPDWLPEFGGMHHLPLKEQTKIIMQTEVPSHLCCSDPSWLYHIYQDTRVNIQEVVLVIAEARLEARQFKVIKRNKHDFENFITFLGPVLNLLCTMDISDDRITFLLSWSVPWNLHIFNIQMMSYSIVLQDVVSGREISKSVEGLQNITITEAFEHGKVYRAWVSCVSTNVRNFFYAVEMCSKT